MIQWVSVERIFGVRPCLPALLTSPDFPAGLDYEGKNKDTPETRLSGLSYNMSAEREGLCRLSVL